jgi:hypothetical protein
LVVYLGKVTPGLKSKNRKSKAAASEDVFEEERRTIMANFNERITSLKAYKDDAASAVGLYVAAFLRELDDEGSIL